MKTHARLALASLTLLACLPGAAIAALTPEEIAIVAARGKAASTGLADYYCRQRGVPEKNIIEVNVPAKEEIDRETWRLAVRPEIKKWLAENDPEGKIRCLVTTWGIPLRITAGDPSPADVTYRKYLSAERESRIDKLRQISKLLDGLAGGSQLTETLDALPENEKEPAKPEMQKLREQLEAALASAQQRIAGLSGDARRADEGRLQQLATAAGGAAVLLQGIAQQLNQAGADAAPPQMRQQFELLRGRASAFQEVRQLLDSRPPSIDRDELALRLIEQTGGLLASVEWLKAQQENVARNERGAAFDSELSLVLWEDGYELLRWQPNYLRAAYDGSQIRTAYPTLMVARIDGPDIKTAKRLIDDAIAVEKAGGLSGKTYLDARGLTKVDGPPQEPGSYADFDQSLLVTAKGLESLKGAEDKPRFEVVLNDQPELFSPGQCPDAALYCGWYSLAKYVDAFDWNRGAVAYHLASGEATTLKELDSECWCRKLLQDGVCATIGPVSEPYLVSFPRPNEFFALLVQGELTLVETYYRTKPFNSWMMTLIGDPLYRPYAGGSGAGVGSGN